MTCYSIELYDKDNDMYSDSFICRTEDEARLVASCLKDLVKQDLIVNRYNGRCEPYDWVEVYKNSIVDGRLVLENIDVYSDEE